MNGLSCNNKINGFLYSYAYNSTCLTLKRTLFPLYTGDLKTWVKNIAFPNTFDASIKMKTVAAKICLYIAAFLLDLASLPIRLLTALPALLFSSKEKVDLQESHVKNISDTSPEERIKVENNTKPTHLQAVKEALTHLNGFLEKDPPFIEHVNKIIDNNICEKNILSSSVNSSNHPKEINIQFLEEVKIIGKMKKSMALVKVVVDFEVIFPKNFIFILESSQSLQFVSPVIFKVKTSVGKSKTPVTRLDFKISHGKISVDYKSKKLNSSLSNDEILSFETR